MDTNYKRNDIIVAQALNTKIIKRVIAVFVILFIINCRCKHFYKVL